MHEVDFQDTNLMNCGKLKPKIEIFDPKRFMEPGESKKMYPFQVGRRWDILAKYNKEW